MIPYNSDTRLFLIKFDKEVSGPMFITEELELFPCTGDMIVYVENPARPTEHQLQLTSAFSKVIG